MSEQEGTGLHKRLDAIGEAMTTSILLLQQDGLLDADVTLAAAYFHVWHVSIALRLDAAYVRGHQSRQISTVAKEIALLASSFNLWALRNARRCALATTPRHVTHLRPATREDGAKHIP